MPTDLIDRDQIPELFGVSLDLVCRLISEKKVQVYPATRKTMRLSHGKQHCFTVHIRQISCAEIEEALRDYRAWATAGEGLTVAHVLKRLHICLSFLQAWEIACDPLGGDPLEPHDGRREGRSVKLYSSAKIKQIEEVFANAKNGRVTIQGVAYLNTERALKYLRKVQKRFCANTLYTYHTAGCPPLENEKITYRLWQLRPGKGAEQAWWPEEKLRELKQALIAQKEGRYLTAAGPRYTSGGAAKAIDVSDATIRAWQKRKRLASELAPNRRGPGKRRRVNTLEALQSAKTVYEARFIGYYEAGSRANLSIVAAQLEINCAWARELVLRHRDAPLVGWEMRTPPRGGRRQHTILTAAIPLLRQERDAELAASQPPPGWKDTGELAGYYQLCKAGELKVLWRTLALLRRSNPDCAYRRARVCHGRISRRWVYDSARIHAILKGRSFSGFLAEQGTLDRMPTVGSDSMASANQDTAKDAEEVTGEESASRLGAAAEDPWMAQQRETHTVVLEIQRSLSDLPKQTAEEVCGQLAEVPHDKKKGGSLANRLLIDLTACSVTFDGIRYEGIDPIPLKLLGALVKAGEGETIAGSELQKRIGVSGKNLTREIGKLPIGVREILKGEGGKGFWVQLPAAPSPKCR